MEGVEAEIEESDEINTRVIDPLRVINDATVSVDNRTFDCPRTTNINDTMLSGSQQSITPSGSNAAST